MRIQKISSYPVYNRSQKQNKLNNANVSTPPCQPQKPSFKKLIDGVKDKEMMWFDEGIPNADFSVDTIVLHLTLFVVGVASSTMKSFVSASDVASVRSFIFFPFTLSAI